VIHLEKFKISDSTIEDSHISVVENSIGIGILAVIAGIALGLLLYKKFTRDETLGIYSGPKTYDPEDEMDYIEIDRRLSESI